MRHFLSVKDAGNINVLIDKALSIKHDPFTGKPGKNKHIGLIFMNPSLRTRTSTQVAAHNLGLSTVVLDTGKDSWQLEFGDGVVMNGKTAEHIKEAAAVLGSYFDILAVRTFPGLVDREKDYADEVINSFRDYAGIPVISLESATRHPLQSLADLMTIAEQSRNREERRIKVVMTWAPHIKPLPQSVPNSFAEWMNTWGNTDFVITHPKGYELAPQFAGSTRVVYDQREALTGADFVYVKNWSSYTDYGKILPVEDDWIVNQKLLQVTNDAKVMHCLPVRRNVVISDDVLDSPSSIVIQQAENRVWAAQAVISRILDDIK